MKKLLSMAFLVLLAGLLAACGTAEVEEENNTNGTAGNANQTEETETDQSEEAELTEIVVGASSTPHAEILEQAQPILEEAGISLVIETYSDFVLPNQDLSEGRLDANYFQHIPYFDDEIAQKGYDFVNLGGIHVEPLGVYSKDIVSIDEIPEGTEVIMSRSIPDHGRILALFEAKGLITLAEDVDKKTATTDDIVENPLNLTFSPDVDPAFTPQAYEREADVLVAINTNYAIEAGLSPLDDALFVEDAASPYVNIIAARTEDEANEALNKLVEVLQSEAIQNFIIETYNGEVVPVGGKNE